VSEWPLTSFLGPIGALPTAPRVARGFVLAVLSEWGMAEPVDVLELIVSEFVTNVVQAATGPDELPRYAPDGGLHVIWLRLLSDRRQLMLEVWDNLPAALGAPVARRADDSDESGRGLDMVEMLSQEWGWEGARDQPGKRVWAVLSVKPEP
jgi:anti-sigma regulatory factor (Ser/Thr protein kinase)